MPVRVEDIASRTPSVSPRATAGAVLQAFLSDPALKAVAIVYDGAPLGHVTRARLTEAMAGPNAAALLANRSITHIMSSEPVMAERGTAVSLIAKMAAEDGSSALTEGVIMLSEGRYAGLISPDAILKAVAQENAARAKVMARSNRRLEEAHRRALQMARDKSAFLAFLGHEIRTPLTGILGIADLLQDSTQGSDARKLARTISESGHHLDRLLTDLLDLSRLEAKKLSINPAPFDLRSFANEARDLWQSRIAERRLDLKIKVTEEAAARIEADAMRIRQILFNLMSNALKFTEKGYINVELSTFEAAGTLKFRMQVSDTGCGVSDEDKARLFEAFEQASASTAQKHGGFGLGLSIAKGLAATMQGEIDLADNPDGGTIFSVTLPVLHAGPRLAVENAPKPRAASLRLGNILIVEDHAVTALVMTRALLAAGWQVETQTSAKAALRKASDIPYQAILTDIHMLDGDGDTIVRQLRSHPGPNQFAPIIAVTADVSEERRKACERSGFTTMIEKPIRPRALVATLADILMAEEASGNSGLRPRYGLERA